VNKLGRAVEYYEIPSKTAPTRKPKPATKTKRLRNRSKGKKTKEEVEIGLDRRVMSDSAEPTPALRA
jgi:hypothetical protein